MILPDVDLWVYAYDLSCQTHVCLLEPSPATIEFFFEHLAAAGAGGNLTTDALIEAPVAERGVCAYSSDCDFAKFRGVQWKNPLTEEKRRNES